MKKTLTVNLGGTVYHIDEDAYILLDNYLNNLRYHFRKDEGAEEIVRYIESRIAALFDEALRGGFPSIRYRKSCCSMQTGYLLLHHSVPPAFPYGQLPLPPL